MKKFLIKRLMIGIIVLFCITFLSFLIINLAPGDPATLYVSADATEDQINQTRENLGLNKPLLVRYVYWLNDLLHGDLGISFATRQPVATMLVERVGPTLLLMGISLIVAYLIAIPLGIYSAVNQKSWVDYFITGTSFLGVSIPNFFLGLFFIYIFAVKLKWFPTGGMQVLGSDGGFVERIRHLILPVSVIATTISANMIRYVRSSMIDVFGENYLRTARAKGLKPGQIIFKHGVRNALIPIITIIGTDIPLLIGGAIVTEQIFQWPGLGALTISSIQSRDYNVLMAITLLSAIVVLIANILTDIFYATADPRIQFSEN
ncbi:ABC transporter permease [Carnobacterium sp. 17-4]|uniref:ABC transporter permease n=1 Tax=Carnobacterium sp. (strain 17-4) TaxID=208596 RepID=UPI000300A7F7|nr:ABC transporter permease [Carnobacterium sp. 17-4]